MFPADDGEAANAALPDHIYMDAMGFGMGNCCLQVKQFLQYIRVHLVFYSAMKACKNFNRSLVLNRLKLLLCE